MAGLNRRHLITGLSISAACAAGSSATAAKLVMADAPADPKLFTTGMLASNHVAASFAPTPSALTPPNTLLVGQEGHHTFADLKGKVRLVTLWAEWCSACIIAMPDLSQLQRRYGGAKFEILAVLTSSYKKLSLSDARNELIKIRADALPLWVEPDGGNSVMKALATQHGKAALPCDLIVDGAGRIRGRSFGTTMTGFSVDLKPEDLRNGQLTDSGQAKVAAAQAKLGAQRSTWSSPEADAFINALANGALD